MKYWLVKSEPHKYSWDDLQKDGGTYWDGVRNYQARNNLRAMQVGDLYEAQISPGQSVARLEATGAAEGDKEVPPSHTFTLRGIPKTHPVSDRRLIARS